MPGTTSFTLLPTAALPSVRGGADPWRADRPLRSANFGHRDAIWLVRMLDLAAAAAPVAAVDGDTWCRRPTRDLAASLFCLSLSRPTRCQHALHPEGHYGYMLA
jgi:hypothetical protein